MGSSPFHGIFAALSQAHDDDKHAASGGELPPANFSMSQTGTKSAASQVGRVAVDIYEQDGYYIIKAPIAGVRLSDIDIEVNDNVITISGSRKQTDAVEDGQYFLTECFWGPFSRSITLPIQIDPKKIKATFNKECVLKILIPKEERVKVVRISEA